MLDLDMSPYAAFVWPAWAISAVMLAGLAARAAAASRRWTAALKDEETRPHSSQTGPQAGRSAIGPKESPQAVRSAVGPES